MSADSIKHFSKLSPLKISSNEHECISLYVHVPYCLQKCHYCDFVKFGVDELPPIEDYFKLLLGELKHLELKKTQKIKTLYFGGGTPSLAPTSELEKIIAYVSRFFIEAPEITLEINPGTLTLQDFLDLKSIGINRFSIGVQSFNDDFLKACGRKHSSKDSFKDLELMDKLDLNYSMDLLFGLPHQTLDDLEKDLNLTVKFQPKHVSPYNLTLPNGHFFNKNRATDEKQTDMMNLIADRIAEFGCYKYEISNFAQKGFESQHNLGYWEDRTYYGLGMGAHSYDKDMGEWGVRYWNPGTYSKYEQLVDSKNTKHRTTEVLKLHESLTDFCHTSLRQTKGLSKSMLLNKFQVKNLPNSLWNELSGLEKRGLIKYTDSNKTERWCLTSTGFEIPNEVFRHLCFLEKDMANERR